MKQVLRIPVALLWIPFEAWRRSTDSGRIGYHLFNAGGIGGIILQFLFWPYEIYRQQVEDSVLGESEFDRETQRFWFTAGWIAVIGLVILVITVRGFSIGR